MAGALAHRGPDDAATWTDGDAGVAFGFRRLAILDLTSAGAQPMHSANGRWVIVFNGEVYNYRRLREELMRSGAAPPFRGHGDTEVMLACIEAWGLERAVQSFIGMFAFALWDRSERRLFLVRDRVGVKPLSYALTPRGVAFASELTALRTLPEFDATIDSEAVRLYAQFGYVPSPWSICGNVRKVRPGTILRIDQRGEAKEVVYWDARAIAESVEPFAGTEWEAEEALDVLLSDAVSLRMIADVPLGVFLSSGVDSPLVVAQMGKHSSHVKSFTIGFEEPELDESTEAEAIASHFGTQHEMLRLRSDEVAGLVPSIASLYDEPFADASSIPTSLVSRLARGSVTVALSGDGGDELFGGYHRHFLSEPMWNRVARVPAALRPMASASARVLSRLASGAMRERASRYAAALRGDARGLYLRDVRSPAAIMREGAVRFPAALAKESWPSLPPAESQMFADFISYLPDDILVKVDRATMAASLEGREPLLDHRVVEFAWSLPLRFKVGEGEGKRILRRVLHRYLPAGTSNPAKRGFGPSVGGWLRGPLRDWTESLLPRNDEWFDAAAVRQLWRSHLAGSDHQVALWRVLMFEAWRARAHRRPD